jgi:hypothetical protein
VTRGRRRSGAGSFLSQVAPRFALVTERTIRLLQERIYDPPRPVEVERDGRWLPALQHAWHLWDDDRGWEAQVEYTVTYAWGIRTRSAVVSADRLRLAEQNGRPSRLPATGAPLAS